MEKCTQKSVIQLSKTVLQLSAYQKALLSLVGFCITIILLAIIRINLPQQTIIQPEYKNMLEEYLGTMLEFGGYLLLLLLISTSFLFGQAYGEKKNGQK